MNEQIRSVNTKAKPRQNSGSSINVILGDVDYILLVTILTLVFFGIMMVFSSSMYTAGNSASFGYDTYYFLKRHLVYAVIGLIAMFIMSNFNYNYLKISIPRLMYFTSIILLILIYTTPLGTEYNGAIRWLTIPGTGFQFQPSDIAKATVIIWVPASIAKNFNVLADNREFAKFAGKLLILIALVGKENMSTAIIMLVIGFGVIFVASPYTLRFVILGVTGIFSLLFYLAYSAFISKSGEFRGARFKAWLDPFSDVNDTGFQTVQGLYAISSGGLFGLGFGKSRQKLDFIPEAYNDIIFAIVCEELGLFGAMMVIFLFILLIFRGIKISLNAPNVFGSLVSAAIVIFIATQAIINISVVTNTIPNTGIALPFISYGGTALIVTLGLMGILLNISRYTTVNRQ